jgi:signal transduction histidine kinase/ligand-binding sensor domain-containing protein
MNEKEATPPRLEAQPRRLKLKWIAPVSRRLTALGRGKAATIAALVLLAAYCLLPAEPTRSLTVALLPRSLTVRLMPRYLTVALLPRLLTSPLLPRAHAQNESATPSSQPTPSPAASPSPSPTPPPNLHQWGAVTSFHGLPSDRTHAIAQTEYGVTWFATDGGLARYDGRRTNAINAEGLPAGRVLALKVDDSGALWVGTDNGAARLANGKFDTIKETAGRVITAIITPHRNRALLSSENGEIFDCQVVFQGEMSNPQAGQGANNLSFSVKTLPTQPLQNADKDHPGPLKITSLAMIGETIYAGTQSRGILKIENGEASDIVSKPRSYFVNALETDGTGHLWSGVRVRTDEAGLFDNHELLKPVKANAVTGPVTAISRGAGDDLWVGTDGRGAFHIQNGKATEHFTFEETGGALRSDHIYGVFVDAEEVVWFATDKGVCRYDPHAMRAENLTDDAGANYVRALLATNGHLLAGTNSGLFTYDTNKKNWQAVTSIGRRIVYAVGTDANGAALVATASGLYSSRENSRTDFATANFVRIPASSSELPQGDSVRALANVGGTTYVATYGYGVERLQGSQRSFVWPDSSADNQWREVTTLGKDSAERLVIGTASAGVFFYDGKQTTSEPALEKLKGDAVWSVVADGPITWLATGKGLYTFQAGELKEIASGVNARALAVISDNSRPHELWCATVGSGLLRVTLDNEFGAIISRLDIEQGLPSQRVFAVWSERNKDGIESVTVGTNRGVVRYQPGRVAPTVLPARIISQRIHQPEELRTGLQLEYPQNSLLLDVTAISSRTFPEQFQYAFALSDNSGKVIREKLSHDSQFAMEKLKPGKYKVVTRAFTKDLLPSTPLSFEFTVARAPFPWTSTALGFLLLLALIALAWGYFQNRRIHRTSAELAAANRDLANARLQLANETETERRRIARDLHDQTLADLRNLALLVDQLPAGHDGAPRNRAISKPSTLRSEIEAISQEVRRICEDLSPSALENVGLSAALQFALAHAVEHAAPDCKFEYEFSCDDVLDERLNLPASAQIQIYRIAQEALSNICRHANARQVRMNAHLTERGTFEMTIEDDGRGFDRSDPKKSSGRGVANIRARASMIEAEAEWKKREGAGTTFVLRKERAAAAAVVQS